VSELARVAPVAISRRDAATIAASACVAAAAIGRIALLFRYRIDSDETQHLHVAWGWAHGLLQYRDLFDNHMPLFHMLAAPFVLLAGERPELLLFARIAMLPLFAATAWLTYRIARSVYPRHEAAWAAALGCLAPDFFLCSIEFRTDDLWALCWLACIAILVCAPLNPRRAALAGFVLGLAAAVSAKTLLLAAALLAAALIARFMTITRLLGLFAAALVPPALIAAYFAWRGAWSAFVHGTVAHNLVTSEHPHRILFLIPSLAIITAVTRRLLREDRKRAFLFLAASLYAAGLISLWPIIETEHWLPFYPLAAVTFVPLLIERRQWLAYAMAAMAIAWIVVSSKPWRDEVTPARTLLAQTLRLTTPTDRVIDLKGELVFRQRAFAPVLEKITKRAISRGRIPDTLAADVLRTHAMVAVLDNDSFPREGRAFLNRNFVDVGSLRVAGKVIPSRTFTIEVPAVYALVSDAGATLDGTLYTQPRFLGAGEHTLVAEDAHARSAVIWERASALQLSPFSH
jgi:hypothetical protein